MGAGVPARNAVQFEAWTAAVLARHGVPQPAAATVARQLLDADLAGYETHGLNLLPEYVAGLRDGRVVAEAQPTAVDLGPSWLQVDGHGALGAVVLSWTMEVSRRCARQHGLCLATIRACGHAGRLGSYVERAAQDGLVMLVMAGSCGDPTDAVAAGPDVLAREMGTNPIAVGVPAADGPFAFDSALTKITYYEAVRAAREGVRVPAGSVRDATGVPCDDPAAFLAGGTLALIGGHKGFGLALGVALLCGLSGEHDGAAGSIGGHLMLVIDPQHAVGGFQRAVNSTLTALRAMPTRDGRPPHLPGDGARARRAERPGELSLTEPLWRELQQLADDIRIPLPEPAS